MIFMMGVSVMESLGCGVLSVVCGVCAFAEIEGDTTAALMQLRMQISVACHCARCIFILAFGDYCESWMPFS